MTSPVKTHVLHWGATALHLTGLLRPLTAVANYTNSQPVFQILAYHRVNNDQDLFFPSIPTAVFEQHMAYIARRYRVLTVETLVEHMQRGDLPRDALALTFDDGYRDNLTHAAPILARYGLTATVFLATAFIGTAEVPWFDRLALAFKTTKAQIVAAPWRELLDLSHPTQRLRALNRTLEWLKRRPDDELRRAVAELLEALDVSEQQAFKNLMLSWDDVHGLMELGLSIGAHTVHHPVLSRVSIERARTEIVAARAMIEAVCGASPRAFAYPNGRPEDYTPRISQLVREAGFTCAVTTRFGVNTSATSPWELRRGGPWESHLPSFALKLAAYRVHTAGREKPGGDISSASLSILSLSSLRLSLTIQASRLSPV